MPRQSQELWQAGLRLDRVAGVEMLNNMKVTGVDGKGVKHEFEVVLIKDTPNNHKSGIKENSMGIQGVIYEPINHGGKPSGKKETAPAPVEARDRMSVIEDTLVTMTKALAVLAARK